FVLHGPILALQLMLYTALCCSRSHERYTVLCSKNFIFFVSPQFLQLVETRHRRTWFRPARCWCGNQGTSGCRVCWLWCRDAYCWLLDDCILCNPIEFQCAKPVSFLQIAKELLNRWNLLFMALSRFLRTRLLCAPTVRLLLLYLERLYV